MDEDAERTEEGEEVEGHKLNEDEDKSEKLDDSTPDEDDEVEAHKF